MIEIQGIQIKTYGPQRGPYVIVNTALKDGATFFDMIKAMYTQPFELICLDVPNWNDDLSPWFAPRLFKNDTDCGGQADAYFQKMMRIMDEVIPDGSTTIIAGYSLAGLFALYSGYQCDRFSGIVCASGSLWFPRWMEYVNGHTISPSVKAIYFSLGDKESQTKNPFLQKTQNNTEQLNRFYHDQGIETIFELNPGNHFVDNELRLAKGIAWILRYFEMS